MFGTGSRCSTKLRNPMKLGKILRKLLANRNPSGCIVNPNPLDQDAVRKLIDSIELYYGHREDEFFKDRVLKAILNAHVTLKWLLEYAQLGMVWLLEERRRDIMSSIPSIFLIGCTDKPWGLVSWVEEEVKKRLARYPTQDREIIENLRKELEQEHFDRIKYEVLQKEVKELRTKIENMEIRRMFEYAGRKESIQEYVPKPLTEPKKCCSECGREL
jgi:hypothetical protein